MLNCTNPKNPTSLWNYPANPFKFPNILGFLGLLGPCMNCVLCSLIPLENLSLSTSICCSMHPWHALQKSQKWKYIHGKLSCNNCLAWHLPCCLQLKSAVSHFQSHLGRPWEVSIHLSSIARWEVTGSYAEGEAMSATNRDWPSPSSPWRNPHMQQSGPITGFIKIRLRRLKTRSYFGEAVTDKTPPLTASWSCIHETVRQSPRPRLSPCLDNFKLIRKGVQCFRTGAAKTATGSLPCGASDAFAQSSTFCRKAWDASTREDSADGQSCTSTQCHFVASRFAQPQVGVLARNQFSARPQQSNYAGRCKPTW